MAPVVASTEVNRSAEDAFAYTIDPTRFAALLTSHVRHLVDALASVRTGGIG